jgi:hypothetical protein
MASIINSTTTSPGGLISTGDSSNSLQIQTGDTTAITVDGSQVVTLANPLPAASGGTGLTSFPAPGTTGNLLTSNGTAWTSAAPPQSGFSGGTNVTSADSVTLTSASTQVQRINITAANKFVILPDATTCTKGGVIFNIINVGAVSFSVIDTSGFTLGIVNPTFSASYFLGDNSTSAGKWSTTTGEGIFTITSPETPAPGGVQISAVLALTDTSGVYVRSSSGVMYSRAYTLSGTTFTWGSETTIYTNPASGQSLLNIAVTKLTDTTFFVGFTRYYPTSRADTVAVACSVSGTTITAGTAVNIRTSGGTNLYFEGNNFSIRVSSSVILYFSNLYNGSNGYTNTVYNPISISGTTITVGSDGTWSSPADSNQKKVEFACLVNATTILMGWSGSGNGQVVVVMSGSSVSSFNITTTNNIEANMQGYAWSPEPNVAFVCGTNRTVAYKFTVSGTSVTQNNSGSPTPATLGGSTAVVGKNQKIVGVGSAGYRIGSTTVYDSLFTANGATPTAGFSTANLPYDALSSDNCIPTASGILACRLVGTGQFVLIKGFA